MIFIDDAKVNGKWYHMMSDDITDQDIHELAQKIGLKRSWFHVDHYDLTESKRNQAIKLGAIPCRAQDLVRVRRYRNKTYANSRQNQKTIP